MKIKKLKTLMKMSLLLICILALSGCAQDTNENVSGTGSFTDEEITASTSGQSDGTEAENTLDASASGESSEEIAGEASADSSEEQAQEPYVLNFEARTIEGESMTSECFAQSRLTMLNIWATYCNPCLSEMPDLGELAVAYDTAEFQIIGIISDVDEAAGEKTIEEAKSLIEQTQANYPHLLLNDSLYSNLVGATTAVPTTFFVNQKGEVLGYVVGAMEKEQWENIINGLLEENL